MDWLRVFESWKHLSNEAGDPLVFRGTVGWGDWEVCSGSEGRERGGCGKMRGVGSPSITTVVPRKVQLLACSNWAVGERPQGSNFRKP